MCRYAMSGPYKPKYVCFHCRKQFRQPDSRELYAAMRTDPAGRRLVTCPECGGRMHNMGLDFKAPRQSDIKQWKKVALLHAHGHTFHSCGCGPGPRPATLREVPAFLHEQEQKRLEQERSLRRASRAVARQQQKEQRKQRLEARHRLQAIAETQASPTT